MPSHRRMNAGNVLIDVLTDVEIAAKRAALGDVEGAVRLLRATMELAAAAGYFPDSAIVAQQA